MKNFKQLVTFERDTFITTLGFGSTLFLCCFKTILRVQFKNDDLVT